MTSALLERKKTHFVFWRPAGGNSPPDLVIGTFAPGNPPTLAAKQTFPLADSPLGTDIFEVAASTCGLTDSATYHYWFEGADSNLYADPSKRTVIPITDPAAYSVDWRLVRQLPPPYNPNPNDPDEDVVPASVVRFVKGKLVPADPESAGDLFIGGTPDVALPTLPPNNRLVIYELPTAWTKVGDLVTATNVGVGTFRDVLALIEPPTGAVPATYSLLDLGVNALELLPPADSYLDRRSWGYGTSNYFAPDFDLGHPIDPNLSAAANAATAPTAVTDLLALVRACHKNGIRFLYDAVMAFSRQDPYRFANYADFHVWWDHGDPEQGDRNGFAGDLWKYSYLTPAFDPITGGVGDTYPARRHMIAHLLHWMETYHLDGLRLDSVVNFGSWDFISDIRSTTRAAWSERWAAEGNSPGTGEDRFIVIGEELAVPKSLLSRIDALWKEDFKKILRAAILGQSWGGEPSFEWTVRKLIDCRNLGFADGSQAVNYLGSHDVGGFGNERLYNYLGNSGVVLKEKPIKLAFVCLLTAVGIPMILAGDEFADQHDFPQITDANKQIDAVNYDRVNEPWRRDIFNYVSRLVKLRTIADALAVNDTRFIHADFNDGKRVLAWVRGRDGIDSPVVVVANFSNWGTTDPGGPGAEYVVSNWPALPVGEQWREVTGDRLVPTNWAGREPLYPWEAKVYVAE